jgi:proteasome beta subunit
VAAAVEALVDASEEDVATGGPDPIRGIYPTIQVVSETGSNPASEEEIRAAYETVVSARESQR